MEDSGRPLVIMKNYLLIIPKPKRTLRVTMCNSLCRPKCATLTFVIASFRRQAHLLSLVFLGSGAVARRRTPSPGDRQPYGRQTWFFPGLSVAVVSHAIPRWSTRSIGSAGQRARGVERIDT